MSFDFVQTNNFLINFESFQISGFMDVRGRFYFLAFLFNLDCKFIASQIEFYTKYFKMLFKFFHDHDIYSTDEVLVNVLFELNPDKITYDILYNYLALNFYNLFDTIPYNLDDLNYKKYFVDKDKAAEG